MRILLLTSRFPYPPHRGDRLRTFHFIEHLSRAHDLTLASFVAGDTREEELAALRQYCREVHVVRRQTLRSVLTASRNAWRSEPLQVLYYRSRRMQRLVDRLVAGGGFDAAYVHLFRMAPYVLHHPVLYRIVDLTDIISKEVALSLPYRSPFWRLVYRIERPRIERYERWVAQHFEETWLISPQGHRALTGACPQANVQVIPNGVDPDHFHPTGEAREPDSLIFVGNLQVFHNVDAAAYLARELLPRVRARIPGCRLKIVGANPGPAVQELGAHPAVTVTGFVPDLNAYLNRAAVFVAPLRFAAGVQNKVLEAMSAGTPVVTTGVVNAGLGARAGRDLLVADDPDELATHVANLLRDAELRSALSHAALEFVHREYSWEHVLRRVQVIQEQLQGAK